jgi:hypothetical protein
VWPVESGCAELSNSSDRGRLDRDPHCWRYGALTGELLTMGSEQTRREEPLKRAESGKPVLEPHIKWFGDRDRNFMAKSVVSLTPSSRIAICLTSLCSNKRQPTLLNQKREDEILLKLSSHNDNHIPA